MAEPPARAAEPSARLISAACARESDFFAIGWNQSLLPDDVPMQRPRSTAHTRAMCVIWPLQDGVAAVPQNSRPSSGDVGTMEHRIAFAVEITRCHLIAQLPYSTALPGPLSMLLLLRLEDASARQTMMISWCHYSDAGTSHRDREPICFGVQCSKISSARRRMCRSPPMHNLPVAISPAHPFFHGRPHGQAEMRRGGLGSFKWCL